MMPLWQCALITISGSFVYLALAVAGWGGFGPFFAQPARIALSVVVLVVAIVSLSAGGNLSSGVRIAATAGCSPPSV